MSTALKDVTDIVEEESKEEASVAPARKIAMIGTAPSTRSLAPFDTDWEIWTQADYWKDLKRIDRWFELAPFVKLEKDFAQTSTPASGYLDFLKAAEFPIYMRQHYPDIPKSQKFPFDSMEAKYGREFMTATLCWMMALAITEHEAGQKISHIGLWGYDMAMDGEYVHQRPGIKHMEWICRNYLSAQGLDPIEVLVPKGSDLLISAIPYPFAEDDALVAKIRARKVDLQKRLDHETRQQVAHTAEANKRNDAINYLRGAMEDLVYFERMACGVKSPAA